MRRLGLGTWICLIWTANSALAAGDFSTLQKSLGIPPSIATVVDAQLSGDMSIPEFILIQDIHRHPEAQANIAALLLHAYHHWNVTTTFLEGVYAGQILSGSPQEGMLTGAELAAAMLKSGHLQLAGLEDSDLYAENVRAYQAAMGVQSTALQEIKTVRLLQQALDLSQRRFSDQQLERLELLARLKLKPLEYTQYLADRETNPCPPVLANILKPAEHFYELADRRSAVFLEHAQGNHSGKPMALVVGGFHTKMMAQLLRDSGTSFVVLSPRVTQSGFDELYARGMQETISALKLR